MCLPEKFGEVNKLPIPSVFTLSTEGANKVREVWQPARWLANFTYLALYFEIYFGTTI